MKIKNLLILGLVLLGFTYCSSDDVLDGPATGDEKVDNLKMEIVIKTPTVRSSTNGVGGSDASPAEESGTITGTINESKINSVLVAIYDASDVTKMYFSETKDPGANGTFKTVEFQIPNLSVGNQYYVYVFANPYEGLQTDLGEAGTKADLNAKFDKNAEMTSLDAAIAAITGEAAKRDNFFMSNATKVLSDPLTTSHIKGESLKVNVDVQRAVARMDYVANTLITENKYTIKETDVEVEFTGYKLINTSKSFYILKRVSANDDGTNAVIGDPESPSNYVVDTDWVTGKLPAGFFNYMGTEATTPLAFTKLEDSSYVTENTSPEGKDALKGHATAVVFKGKLNVENDKNPIYVWGNKVYKSYADLPLVIRTVVGVETELVKLAANGVTKYTYEDTYGYPVYYVYYNKHNANADNTSTGPMEFAVVRNNVYKLTINGLSRFGHPNDPELVYVPETSNPDPSPEEPADPIETADLYMQVTATVLNWTVRTNEIEF